MTGRSPGCGGERQVRAFAPATLSNLGSGFDVLGLALEAPGDLVTARRCASPGVRLAAVRGDGGRLPREGGHNTCGIAAAAVLAAAARAGAPVEGGVELELDKGLPLASGLGSSAASAAAAAVAVDRLLDLRLAPAALLDAVLAAEEAACGARHPDNAAPCLAGGWVLVRPGHPPDVVPLPVPEGLAFAVVRPHVELATREMRRLLPPTLPLADATRQWGNLAALVAALHSGDLELLARGMVDVVAEPRRAPHVPGFAAARAAALAAGALAAGLSGSGPSMFAACRDRHTASRVATAMERAVTADAGIACDVVVSPVAARGARPLAEGEPVPVPGR